MDESLLYDYCNRPIEVADITNSFYKSLQGKYFMGRTEELELKVCKNAWAGLFNPPNSGMNLFVNTFTVSNTGTKALPVQIWFNAGLLNPGKCSLFVTSANTALMPHPFPKTKIKFSSKTNDSPISGIYAFERIVPANFTEKAGYDGKIIIPPGGNFLIFIPGRGMWSTKVSVGFGWWEEKA